MSDPATLLTREVPAPTHTLHYGSHPEQLADIWTPESTPRAVVIFLHGGFWRDAYDRRYTAPLTHALAQRGCVAANVEYRRVGGAGGNPATFDDIVHVERVLPAMVRESCAVPADTPMLFAGHSAGGHLALWSSARDNLDPASTWHRDGRSPFDGVLALAGVCDVSKALAEGLDDGAAADLLDGRDNLAEIDPAQLGASRTPTALVHGHQDQRVPFEYSAEAAERLASAGTPHRFEPLADAGHFELVDPDTQAWQRVLAALEWLEGTLST